MKKILSIVFLFLLLGYFFPQYSSAYYGQVLGDTTKPIIMPPTVEGPGLILPDSPFYFLDKLKQKIRVAFAFGSDKKAKVYEDVAGERLAEFRFELAKNNKSAADIALQGMRDNTQNAAEELASAQFAGQNVDTLARDINRSIKQHQQALDAVEMQANGETKAAIAWAQASLTQAKDIVENTLPKDELDNEVRDDMVRDATKFAVNTTDAAKELKTSLDILQQQASDAAKNNLQKRQDALQQAINQKNSELKKVEEIKLAEEKRKDDLSLSLQNQAAMQAQDIIQRAQEVATKIQTTQQVENAPLDTNVVLGASSSNSAVSTNASNTSKIKH